MLRFRVAGRCCSQNRVLASLPATSKGVPAQCHSFSSIWFPGSAWEPTALQAEAEPGNESQPSPARLRLHCGVELTIRVTNAINENHSYGYWEIKFSKCQTQLVRFRSKSLGPCVVISSRGRKRHQRTSAPLSRKRQARDTADSLD